jgi:hypothetical protein
MALTLDGTQGFVGDVVGNLTGNVTGNATTATKFTSAPAFAAYQSTAQTVPSGTYTKVQLQTEEYDTNNCFDSTTNYRFTPNVAGYYQLNAAFFLATSSVTVVTAIYKNGTIYKKGSSIATAGGTSVSSLVYLNGSTDYVEFYCYASTGQALLTGVENTYFNGVLVKPA